MAHSACLHTVRCIVPPLCWRRCSICYFGRSLRMLFRRYFRLQSMRNSRPALTVLSQPVRHRPRRICFRTASKIVPIIRNYPPYARIRTVCCRTLPQPCNVYSKLRFEHVASITAIFLLVRASATCHDCTTSTALFLQTAFGVFRIMIPSMYASYACRYPCGQVG